MPPINSSREEPADQVVELRGSSACFEYQFPASPEFFIGRDELLRNVENYVSDVIANRTSSRGILFEANSGWGKSSLVLATVARLMEHGHYALLKGEYDLCMRDEEYYQRGDFQYDMVHIGP